MLKVIKFHVIVVRHAQFTCRGLEIDTAAGLKFSKYYRCLVKDRHGHRHCSANAREPDLPTIQQLRDQMIDAGIAAWGKKNFDKTKICYPKRQDELPPRKMKDTFQEVMIPLSDAAVRQKYLNVFVGIRFGRLLEDMDTFAGVVCFKYLVPHISQMDPRRPVMMATALVDKISLEKTPIAHDKDIKMLGYVSWCGSSSMEITINLEQEKNESWNKLLEARLLFVSRNVLTGGPAFVNPLQAEGLEEEKIMLMGEARKKERISEGQETLLKTPPNEQERQLIHNTFLQTMDPKSYTFRVRVKPDNSEWMENARLKNLIVCFPEQKNINNKIFGGFLMRKAFELAWVNATLFSKTRPTVCVVDDIVFRRPVEIGSLLFLSSQIVYTEGSKMQVFVHAEVVNPKDGSHKTTNDFHFTFDTELADLKNVIPKTYAESMLYLEGKRHFES
ncbi:hypothetical protein ScPMuIL_017863 [Solemya velum]